MNINYHKFIEYSSRDIKNIFKDLDINKLSDYDKRKLIFNFLCDNWTYNWSEFLKMSYEKVTEKRYSINNAHNLYNCIVNRICLCNSISSYYMLLLKAVGIDSSVVCTDNGYPIKHAINIVYSKDTDTYSFDDVSSSIIHPNNREYYFDYDLNDANNLMQGNTPFGVYNVLWLRLPNVYTYALIDDYIGYDESIFKSIPKYNIPDKIISYKKK